MRQLTRRMLVRRGIYSFLSVGIGGVAGSFIAHARDQPVSGSSPAEAAERAFEPLEKPKAEWRKLLPARSYDVLFEEDTERPWSSPLNKEKRDGTFICAACFLPLFEAKTKYESGTGWPSFWQPIEGRVSLKGDFLLVLPRTEYHCARCGGHQGHVFEDGPRPTGQRWCNNGVALEFVPADEKLPGLRT